MFSALKRLTGKAEANGSPSPKGHQTMSQNLQRKFAKGVQYNMKIIIKGDRNVGKSCLFQRLQGKKFIEEYIPTEEIQVASIQWNYKATDDIVKVEVWDVVDRGKKKKRFDGLKLDNSQLEVPEEPVLDAEFLDVYKGTNGVIIMMDITKSWTFEYIQRELPKVPNHIPVLVLANHCDMSHHRTVTPDHVTYFIEGFERPPGSAQVRYAEASMRNGFGLKLLHKFFNLPFLQLQRETLLGQLETNEHETQLTSQELDLYQESEDADYNTFLDNLMNKRRQMAELSSGATSPAPAPAAPGTSAQPFVGPTPSPSVPGMRRSASVPGPIPCTTLEPRRDAPLSAAPKDPPHVPSPVTPKQMSASQSVDSFTPSGASKASAFMSKIFGKAKDNVEDSNEQRLGLVGGGDLAEPITSVEEFVPDGGMIDRSFLEDTAQERTTLHQQQHIDQDSDSDVETGNPLVAGFQDELDPEDVVAAPHPAPESRPHPHPRQRPRLETPPPESDRDEEVADITSDQFDSWLGSDSKWRRSPEGGEDSAHSTGGGGGAPGDDEDEGTNTSVSSSNVHSDLLESSRQNHSSSGSSPVLVQKEKKKEKHRDKHKSEDKSAKKHKKKGSKDKESAKTPTEEKKKKKKSVSRKVCEEDQDHDELEEFLNGPGMVPVDAAYEAI